MNKLSRTWFLVVVFFLHCLKAQNSEETIAASESETASAVPTTLDLHWVDNDKYPLAVCNEETKAGFYYAASKTGSGLWLVHLQGGRWCFNQKTCDKRWQNSPQFMTSRLLPANVSKTGVFDGNSQLNPLADANKVFVHYCTSDAWLGDRAGHKGNIWAFRGQKVLEAVLHTLQSAEFGMRSEKGATALLLSGCGVGALGAAATLDYLPRILNDGRLKVYGLLDSPLFADVEPYAFAEQLSHASQTRRAFHVINATKRVVDSECSKCLEEERKRWKCIFAQYLLPSLELPFILNNAQFDAALMEWNMGFVAVDKYTADTRKYVAQKLRPAIRQVADELKSNVLSSACYSHCVSETADFWRLTVSGQSYASATARFLRNEGVLPKDDADDHCDGDNKWVDDCEAVHCGNGCPEIDTSKCIFPKTLQRDFNL